jgi:selenide,water dikinase
VHALTDVTGFGLLGHALEMCRGAHLSADLIADPPLLAGVEILARAGVRTGASGRNWQSYGDSVAFDPDFPDWRRDILCDPQTSGGLLIAAAPTAAREVLALARSRGFGRVVQVGRFRDGPAEISVRG